MSKNHTPLSLLGPDNMLASANMLAPKRSVKSCLGVATLCLASRCPQSAPRFMKCNCSRCKTQKACICEPFQSSDLENFMSLAITTSTFGNIVYEKKGPIAYITLNRPKVLNALNKSVITELKTAFEAARDDSTVRGVIFTGAGDKAFAAGADISEMLNDTPLEAEAKTRLGQAVTTLIENLGKPVIAAVNGYALGGGCELAMASTIRLASETAKFGQPEVKIGIMPGYGGTQRLPRLVR